MMSAIESNVMVDPIDDSGSIKRNAGQRRSHEVARPISVEETGQISLSDISRQVALFKEAILNVPEVNLERVKLLKEELASGRYQVFCEKIAAKMVK